tara:strand:- start:10573 stop:11571 length:999 start_codon:yes stop_codon:yes gene_type:complete
MSGYDWDGIPESRDIVEADDINDGTENAEQFINNGISDSSFRDQLDHVPEIKGLSVRNTGDADAVYHSGFKVDGFIEKKHILKPNFYSSPSPRFEGVSSQVHYRSANSSHRESCIFTPSTSGGSWDVIPGTASRLKLRDNARVYVYASFYCYELGGVQHTKSIIGDDDFSDTDYYSHGYQSRLAGIAAISVQGKDGSQAEKFSSTKRRIYTTLTSPRAVSIGGDSRIVNDGRLLFHMLGRNQHSIAMTTSLNAGIYDVGMVFRCSSGDGYTNSFSPVALDEDAKGGKVRRNKTVFFKARNLVIDVQYFDRPSPAGAGLEDWRTKVEFDEQRL